MRITLSIALLVLLFGILGIATRRLLADKEGLGEPSQAPKVSCFEDSFEVFLSGLAVLSLLMMFLALLGIFSLAAIVGAVGLIGGGAGWRIWRAKGGSRSGWPGVGRHLLGFLVVACVALVAFWLGPPYEAKLNSADAPVYLGVAAHLAESGRLAGEDSLVAEMTAEERQVLFANRFGKDATGPYARFPGGVQLLDPARAFVSFHFYHLWPVWLALGLKTMGSPDFLSLLPFFASVSLISLFLLGQLLVGRGFGLAIVLLLFFSFPQLYYSRLPLSEIPAQAFFLAGLLCFVRALQEAGPRRRNLQILTAVLWGCLCLCRVDGVLFLFPALACSFVLCAELRRSVYDWLPLAVGLAFLASLAILHQIAGASYGIPLADLPVIGGGLHSVNQWIMDRERALVIAWLALAAGAVLIGRWQPGQGLRRGLGLLAGGLFLVISVVWFVAFFGQAKWSQLLHHLHWLELYLPGWLMAGSAVGLGILGIAIIRQPQQRTVRGVLFIFLAVPLASFLINPMVTATQPWAIRRFVPMALPLLFTLALLGWEHGLSAVGRRFGRNLNQGYAVLAVVVLAYLLPKSALLWRQPLYVDLGLQVNRLANRIPADALVILPDEEAGMHVQIPLQYNEKRSTLLLPVTGQAGTTQSLFAIQYLRRQLAGGRPVIALFQEPSLLLNLLTSNFALEYLFSEPISFFELPQVAESQFPGMTRERKATYRAFQVREHGREAVPATINIGQITEDLPFIVRGFYAPEGDPAKPDSLFRWTMAEAELRLPAVRKVRVHFLPWRPVQAPAIDLAILVNGVRVKFQQVTENGQEVIDIPVLVQAGPGKQEFKLTIACQPFSMRDLGLSDDARSLGIAISHLELLD
jgi:hypothetical protein